MNTQYWQQIFGHAALALASDAPSDHRLQHALRACLPALGDFATLDLVVSPTEVRRIAVAPNAPGFERELVAAGWERQQPRELCACAISAGEAVLRPSFTTEELARLSESPSAWLKLLAAYHLRSMLSVPLLSGGRLVAGLNLFMAGTSRHHGQEHLDHARQLCALLAPVVACAMPGAAPVEHRQLLVAEQRARDEAESARRRFELLAKAGDMLAGSLDTDNTLQAIAQAIVPAVADWVRIDLLDEHGKLRRAMAYHPDPERARIARDIASNLRPERDAKGTLPWVATTGRSIHGRLPSPLSETQPVLSALVEALDLRYYFCLPLVARGRTVGAMAVVQAESGRDLGEQDRALIRQLAERAALALDNARLYAEAGAAREQAEQANRAKDDFLAMLGHELRNPLAPIAMALELMSRRQPDFAQAERRIIGRQVSHLSRLIDDLLDVSRIAHGKIQLQSEVLDLRTVVQRALELTAAVYEQRAPVKVELPEQPVWVEGDSARLAQVLNNLLVNAAKFTPPGGSVSLRVCELAGQAQVEVEDTGSGIAPELLPRVFELFVQGRQAIDRQSGGLGLGLSIVRSLTELHGGCVTASSEGPGRGSRFTVQLPLRERRAVWRSAAPCESGVGTVCTRILVVDDNVDAAHMTAELLEVLGHEVCTAYDAHEAMEKLDDFRPELALLDIGLPQIDGYQLARMIRERREGRCMPLVALTGYGSPQDRARALAAGFDEHLTKPVSVERLLQAIESLTVARMNTPERTGPPVRHLRLAAC